ncbi:MAG TPA: tetraacyldisaccharide 4'-kinase [Sulfurovum sp.]|nr:tetraacyldisaccharide 4'-kinase [Sulfurovum sp.]
MKSFFEQVFFSPKWYHYVYIIGLFPFSLIYGMGMWLRRKFAKTVCYRTPIISVGNLIVGGSGKTPFVINLASKYPNVAIISRGYGRQSKGLVEVSRQGKILVDVKKSGDEPMLMAMSLPEATVVVSEDRDKAIDFVEKRGVNIIILDDGFNKVKIDKYDILLEPEKIRNHHAFPSGPFREFYSTRKQADFIAREEKEFTRKVTIKDATDRMILVTAISNPKRLDKYLPSNVVQKYCYADHAYFNEKELKNLLKANHANSILCTSKDRVKMDGFKLPISEMKLELEIQNEIFTHVDEYIEGYDCEK